MSDPQLHGIEQNPLGIDLIIVGSIFVGLVWPAFALRWWARKLIHGWGWDDKAILCATILFTIYTAVAMACAVLLSRGATTVSSEQLRVPLKLLLTSVVLYIVTMFSLKASLGAFFLRICIRRSQRIVIYISVLLMTIITLLYTGIVIFQCGAPQHAIGHFYNPNIPCVAGSVLQGLGYAHGATNALTDINFLFLGIWTLQQSQMRPRDKALVGLILGVGTIGSVGTLIRFKYIHVARHVSIAFLANAKGLSVWSCVECGLGITAACLATYRPIFRRWSAFNGRLLGNHNQNSQRYVCDGSNCPSAQCGGGSRERGDEDRREWVEISSTDSIARRDYCTMPTELHSRA